MDSTALFLVLKKLKERGIVGLEGLIVCCCLEGLLKWAVSRH